MTGPIAEHAMTTVVCYRLLTLRDQDNDAGVGGDEAVVRAATEIAASTGYELFVSCVQDLFPVTARVTVWDGEPADLPGDAIRFALECPTGLLVLGSPTGEYTDFVLPAGPGEYRGAVTHQGRTEAERVRREALELPDGLTGLDRHAGIERYTIHLWYAGPVEDE